MLCAGVGISITLYVYYTIIIKIRPFPEDGILSASGCYVTRMYNIPRKYSIIINYIYSGNAAFVKVFEAKTKQCVYTSNIYHIKHFLPLIDLKSEIHYGFLSINTECKKEFVPPEEFTPD